MTRIGRLWSTWFLCLAVLTLLVGLSSASGQSAKKVAKKAFRETVLLVTQDRNGQPLSLGSGFFVRCSQVVTNLHVIEDAAGGYAKRVGRKRKFDIEGISAIDSERDLAILRVPGTAGMRFLRDQDGISEKDCGLRLGDSQAVEVGEAVYAVGNPRGLEGTFSQGIVSSIREIGVEVGTDTILQITAPISPGSSGGPVLNQRGEVIGVSVATFKGGQNLNFAIPSTYVKALLANLGPPRPLATSKAAKSTQRSILAGLGGNTHGVIGAKFSWIPFTGGAFTFSIRNRLRKDIKEISCLVVLYDEEGVPLDYTRVQYSGTIRAGLAKRVRGSVDASVRSLTSGVFDDRPRTKVEIRVLDFEVVK